MSDDSSEENENQDDGDPSESKAAFKKYLINILVSNELD